MMSKIFFLSSILLSSISASADPLIHSWFTDLSGRYARIYTDNATEVAQAPVTTWSRGAGTQSLPTYAGIHEIATTATDVYIRTSNLGYHIMGPWYGDNGNLFPNWPANQADIYRIPRNINTNPSAGGTTKILTGGGTIGYMVDGISLFDSRDAFSFDTSQGVDEIPQTSTDPNISGDGIWNRDAYINEGDTFDPAFAHQAGATHHYHANAPALRHLLGDSVDYAAATNTYTENFNGTHSPIIGWFRDGIPLYGPYGYSSPLDPSSGVRQMISGYQKRDGSNGSLNLAAATGTHVQTNLQGAQTGRTVLPDWVPRNEPTTYATANLTNTQYGPPVSAASPIGHYLQDYAYKGDLGLSLYNGTGAFNHTSHFDLNEYNVRWCVTPEYPSGTWAYFTNIESDGTPAFPYNIGRYYFENPVGNSPTTIPNTATVIFEGGPEIPAEICALDVNNSSGDVTLTWSSIEGGHYSLERNPNMQSGNWTSIASPAGGINPTTTTIDVSRANTESKQFYRAALNSIEPFDDSGFVYDDSIVQPPPQNNILLLILDDWGIDAFDLYNTRSGPNIAFANMPHLKSLLFTHPATAGATSIPDKGLLFDNGHSQPICSPTRATILTGRHPYQHTVGNPNTGILPSSELTFPEIMQADAPSYGLASFGKWHLGNDITGPRDVGGWPTFQGTIQGGVSDYAIFDQVSIINGVLTDGGTDINTLVANGDYASPYATSVQVDNAVNYITGQGTDPWCVWMGFNAPHTPWADPATHLTPTAGYSGGNTTDKENYIRMLEALDHEIGRLLASVDLTKTNIIVVGDNGTPGPTDQAPAGGLASAKGSLFEGGIHVPFFAAGPDVTVTGRSNELVHVVDLFSTILDLASVNVSVATTGIDIHSKSLLPIFQGNDMEDRCIISEKFNLNATTDGRALIDEDWPQYKLIAINDVTDPNDAVAYQMYEIGTEGVEINTLTTPPAPGDPHETAYNLLVAKDLSLQPSASNIVTVDLDIPNPTSGTHTVTNNSVNWPQLTANGGGPSHPLVITVGGVNATWDGGTINATLGDGGTMFSASRVDDSGNSDRWSLRFNIDLGIAGFAPGSSHDILIRFQGGNGGQREYTLTNAYTAP